MMYVDLSINAAAIIFWVLVLGEMAFASLVFCEGNKWYDKEIKTENDRRAVNLSLWFLGFLSMGLPIFQVGSWIDGSDVWAWGLVIAVVVFWVFVICYAWFDS